MRERTCNPSVLDRRLDERGAGTINCPIPTRCSLRVRSPKPAKLRAVRTQQTRQSGRSLHAGLVWSLNKKTAITRGKTKLDAAAVKVGDRVVAEGMEGA